MSQIVVKIDSKTTLWNLNRRFKPGQSVIYSGYYWTNLTGANSEPGVGTDWIQVGTIFSATPTLSINGIQFSLHKTPGNSDVDKKSTLEVNDMVIGWWDANTFFPSAIYIGGDIDTKSSYNEVNSIEDIVPI